MLSVSFWMGQGTSTPISTWLTCGTRSSSSPDSLPQLFCILSMAMASAHQLERQFKHHVKGVPRHQQVDGPLSTAVSRTAPPTAVPQ